MGTHGNIPVEALQGKLRRRNTSSIPNLLENRQEAKRIFRSQLYRHIYRHGNATVVCYTAFTMGGRSIRCPQKEGSMWMNSRFAQWEVEGEVRQRVSGALHEWEQERLARAARSTGVEHNHGNVLSSIYGRLGRLVGRAVAGSLSTLQDALSFLEDGTEARLRP